MNFRDQTFRLLFASALVLPLAWASMGAARAAEPPKPIDVSVTIPETSSNPQEFNVTDAQFRWGLNIEASSGAYEPETCNFLSAGEAGDAGSSRHWTKQDGFYSQKTGNVQIEKPDASGKWVEDSWNSKCLNAQGRAVGTAVSEQGTGSQVVIDGGNGKIHTGEKTATIKWKGSFTSAMYNGRTYWTATDPILTITNGKGTLKATLSGYGADREDASRWSKIEPREVVLATLPSVTLGDRGIVTDPAYKQVLVKNADTVQHHQGNSWGSFPQNFVDFQSMTGQGAYWYSTGGTRDAAKIASTLYISYTPENSVLPVAPPSEDANENTGNVSGGDANGTGSVPGESTTSVKPTGTVIEGSVLPSALSPGGSVVPDGTVLPDTPVGTVLAAATTSAVGAANWLGGSLIPQGIEFARDYKDWLLWSVAGLLGLATLAWVGFRQRWLALPFIATKPDK